MTFSISGRCRRTGMFGVAVSTSSIAVGARCPFARAGVGAVATQNITNPSLGPKGLDLLAAGLGAKEVVERLVSEERFPEFRQLAVIGRAGPPAHYSGAKTLGTHNVAPGTDCVAAGNLLANRNVP
ncbi:MAG: DUF1028 domain-containing protein, partial [Alphaproteobacteria bacterium]